MKRYLRCIFFLAFAALFAGVAWLTLRATSEYPTLDAPVSYRVNQVDGFELSIRKPSWSPFKGYTIHWRVSANSEEVYHFIQDGEGPGFEYLERYIDGHWYRLGYSEDTFLYTTLELALGGDEGSALEGSIVQKYSYYGTRLEPGDYRLVLEMREEDGSKQYLASDFEVE
ncbi:hypothetical protein IMSAG049_00703 [Clostridiales bacterium]|nr:hypothetical protein IMSAG049_00703 [Clostridiales bacterium]